MSKPGNSLKANSSATPGKETEEDIILKISEAASASLLRLFVKRGEYIYVRAGEILMIESCDHFVRLYIAVKDSYKVILRHATFKEFLSLLPSQLFLRLSRFCAINISRLSAGNSNEQYLEFDFRIIIRPASPLNPALLSRIGR